MSTVEIAAIRFPEPVSTPVVAGLTHQGLVREDNQDSHHIDEARRFAIVADGMGGHQGGALASRSACEAAAARLSVVGGLVDGTLEESMRAAFDAAFGALATEAARDPKVAGMGTTLLCAALDADSELVVAHLGDSRLYRLREGHLRCLTDDHNVLSELVRAGVLSGDRIQENRRLAHLLTRAISPGAVDRPDVFRTMIFPGDIYLLCSDGLHGPVGDTAIAALLALDTGEEEICQALVDAALSAGAPDNITTVVMRF